MGSIARKMGLAVRVLLCDLETMVAQVDVTVGTAVAVVGTVAYPEMTAPGSAAAVVQMDCKTDRNSVVAEIAVVAVAVAVAAAAAVVVVVVVVVAAVAVAVADTVLADRSSVAGVLLLAAEIGLAGLATRTDCRSLSAAAVRHN